jgi:hypothetical protein
VKVDHPRILVCAPHVVTGGPELLHQLVHTLRGLGRDAYITYYPFEQSFEVPEPYRIYDAPVARFSDDPDTFVIIPESATPIQRRVRLGQTGVWWMSVDNYFYTQGESRWIDWYTRYRSLLNLREPISRLRHAQHFVQSEYARQFLADNGLASELLTDYLNPAHLARTAPPADARQDIVVYNPKKGVRRTRALMRRHPDLRFVALENMTPAQVSELLGKAKVYIDFGHHPGKDRAPREAALAGCCVITGRRGAASNAADIPIPPAYKLDDSSGAYLETFRPLVESIFTEFVSHASEFHLYRDSIRGEHARFQHQVRAIFA